MISALLYGTYDYLGGLGGYGYYGFDWTYILVIIGAIFSMAASSGVKSTYAKYSKIPARCGLTGAEAAQRILNNAGIYDVKIEHIRGQLTDHFDPSAMVLRLSDAVYGSTSIGAISVAAHECGHAMQKNESYFPMTLRHAFVVPANLGSKAGIPILIGGMVLSFQPLVSLGIILFSAGFLFHVITLPVEFNASARALETLGEMHILDEDELVGGRKTLKAAALTYVASAAAALLTLLRLILKYGGKRRK